MDIKDVLTAYLDDLEYNSSSLSKMNNVTNGTPYFYYEHEMHEYIEKVKALIETLKSEEKN